MKKIFLVMTCIAISFAACKSNAPKDGSAQTSAQSTEVAVNTLSADEQAEGWQLMFNGKDFTGWRGYNKDSMPAAWVIEDNSIKIVGSGNGEAGAENGGDIIFATKFKNFDLKFEWKVSKGANSGVLYLAQEKPGQEIWKSSPEYQVLDNAVHPDARLGKDGNRQSSSLYDLIPANPQNFKGSGEWNTGEILVYKGTVIHYQNGEKVLEYHLWTEDWNNMIKNSKFADYPDFLATGGENHEGYIGLQDHGDDVWYRNIKIKNMD